MDIFPSPLPVFFSHRSTRTLAPLTPPPPLPRGGSSLNGPSLRAPPRSFPAAYPPSAHPPSARNSVLTVFEYLRSAAVSHSVQDLKNRRRLARAYCGYRWAHIRARAFRVRDEVLVLTGWPHGGVKRARSPKRQRPTMWATSGRPTAAVLLVVVAAADVFLLGTKLLLDEYTVWKIALIVRFS